MLRSCMCLPEVQRAALLRHRGPRAPAPEHPSEPCKQSWERESPNKKTLQSPPACMSAHSWISFTRSWSAVRRAFSCVQACDPMQLADCSASTGTQGPGEAPNASYEALGLRCDGFSQRAAWQVPGSTRPCDAHGICAACILKIHTRGLELGFLLAPVAVLGPLTLKNRPSPRKLASGEHSERPQHIAKKRWHSIASVRSRPPSSPAVADGETGQFGTV